MKTIKILVTAPNLITGGAEKQLIYLIGGLVKKGFSIVLFLFELEGEYVAEVPNEVKILTPRSPKPRKALKGLWKIKEIAKVISREKPDVLYSRLWPTKVATAFAGLLMRKKVVFSEDITLIWLMDVDEGGRGEGSFNLQIKKAASQLANVVVPVSRSIADELG